MTFLSTTVSGPHPESANINSLKACKISCFMKFIINFNNCFRHKANKSVVGVFPSLMPLGGVNPFFTKSATPGGTGCGKTSLTIASPKTLKQFINCPFISFSISLAI